MWWVSAYTVTSLLNELPPYLPISIPNLHISPEPKLRKTCKTALLKRINEPLEFESALQAPSKHWYEHLVPSKIRRECLVRLPRYKREDMTHARIPVAAERTGKPPLPLMLFPDAWLPIYVPRNSKGGEIKSDKLLFCNQLESKRKLTKFKSIFVLNWG